MNARKIAGILIVCIALVLGYVLVLSPWTITFLNVLPFGLNILYLGMWSLATLAAGDIEPNDDFDTAEQIVAGVYEGELHNGIWPHDNEDFYKGTLVAGQLIYVNVTSTLETSAFLYDDNRK